MTTRDMILMAGAHPQWLSVLLLAPPVTTFVAGRIHRPGLGHVGPWRYLYAVLVYMTCLPGIFSGVMVGYMLFFTRENLLDMDLLATIAPLGAMALTLALMGRQVDLRRVPGFGRLSGLIMMLVLTFIGVLAIEKTRILVAFTGGFMQLMLLAVLLFLGFKLAAHLMFGGKRARA